MRTGRQGALLCLDLDHFKTINDTLGHDMGDVLLQQVAQRLTAHVRAGDTVARLGGDEFLVVLRGVADPAAAEALASRLIGLLSEPLSFGTPFWAACAIGDVAGMLVCLRQAGGSSAAVSETSLSSCDGEPFARQRDFVAS